MTSESVTAAAAEKGNDDEERKVDRDCIECDGPDCTVTAPSKRCSRCHTEFYCSVACQKKAWKNHHKPYCIPIDEMRLRLAGLKAPADVVLGSSSSGSGSHQGGGGDNKEAAINAECPICLSDPVQNPVILKACHHAFCSRCLIEWQKRFAYNNMVSKANIDTTPCPFCRTETGEDIEDKLIEKARLLGSRAICAVQEDAPEQRAALCREALDCIEKVLETEFPRIDSYFTKAELLMQLERHSEAIEVINECIAEDMRRKELPLIKLLQQSDQAQANGDMAEFERLKQDVVDAFEKLGQIPSQLKGGYMDCYLIQADAYQAQKDFLAAKALYIKMIQAVEDPETIDPVPMRKCWMGAAKCAYELGDFDKAIAASDAALYMNRHFPGAHKYKALALKELGRLDEAIHTMKRAVLYEAPWDEEHKATVWALYKELCAKKKEQAGD